MKKPILALLVFASQLAFSQGISVVSNEQLPIPSGSNYLPVLSPAGDFLVLTNSDMNGLQKYDLATKKMTTLTTKVPDSELRFLPTEVLLFTGTGSIKESFVTRH